MTINGIKVTGIKEAVGDVRREQADRWAILLDMSDWSVCERSLIGQDWIETTWPIVQIAEGYGQRDCRRETTTMAELRDKVGEIIEARKRAIIEFADGYRHTGGEEWGETRRDYICTELQAAGLI